jgi:hypothetical protein
MKNLVQQYSRRRFVAGGIAAAGMAKISLLSAQQSSAAPAFQFLGTDYFFRSTNDKLFEFTPQDKADLNHFLDMFSVFVYREAKTPEILAAEANALIGGYKERHAIVWRTASLPATSEKPAEYFIAGMLAAKGLVEGVFNRLVLNGEVGYNLIYSHRIYGKVLADNAKLMVDWARSNGAKIEKALMNFTPVPTIDILQKWKSAGPSK